MKLTARFRSLLGSDIAYSFRRSRLAVIATVVLIAITLGALGAEWFAPQDPFDISQLDLLNSELPPMWVDGGDAQFPLGTDTQARDVLSSLLYGARVSLGVGFASVLLAVVLGVSLGLLSGYTGGLVDAVIMRVADVILSFPAILVALVRSLTRQTLEKFGIVHKT